MSLDPVLLTVPAASIPEISGEPPRDCALCPRLHQFMADWRAREPDWHNAPVATWMPPGGAREVKLLIAGLAPGLRGANRTGRPFTGDFSGDLLYATLGKFGFARGGFNAWPDDGMDLVETAITNAVRCVPPENKPTAAEVNTCRGFLKAAIDRFENLRVIVTLGKIAHDSTIRAFQGRVAAHPFRHGAATAIDGTHIVSSYHCSRYNINTGVLIPAMFEDVFQKARALVRT